MVAGKKRVMFHTIQKAVDAKAEVARAERQEQHRQEMEILRQILEELRTLVRMTRKA